MTPQKIYQSDTYAGYQRLHAELTDYRGYEPYDLLPKDAWRNARAAALSHEPKDSTDYLKALIKVPAVRRCGPVPLIIENPFYGHLDFQDRYEPWSEDVLVGVARLDHGGTKQLPVKVLYDLLEALEDLSAETIGEHLGASSRTARRYLAALYVAMQYLMRSRPQWLRVAMGDMDSIRTASEPESLCAVCPKSLQQLRLALGADAFAS